MKKLFMMLTGIAICFSVSAQIKLEGLITAGDYNFQSWDGEYLVYHNLGQTIIYHYESQEMELVPIYEPIKIRFKKGLYFKMTETNKWQMHRFGEETPVFQNEFDRIGYWIGDQILAYEQLSGKDRGYRISWISEDGHFIAQHRLNDIEACLGIEDYFRYTSLDKLVSLTSSVKSPYREGLMPLQNPDSRLWGFFDLSLKQKVSTIYDEVSFFSEGLVAVKNKAGYWGYVDTLGKEVIPLKFSKPSGYFSDGLATFRSKENRIGFINKSGEVIIPAEYIGASPFYKGKTIAYRRDRGRVGWYFLDLEGNETKGPCEICEFRQSKNFYSNEIDQAPYRVLVNWVDDGMGMFLIGRGFKIFDHQNKLLYKA